MDLRFTDTKGKEQHVTVPAHSVNEDLFEDGKMFDGSSIAGWKQDTWRTAGRATNQPAEPENNHP